MDEFFRGIGCKQKFSMADSIMMSILHSSMNKAHEKVRFKEGVFERLSEQSKFYELAIMQLEACIKFVQLELEEEEEADDYYGIENQYDKLLYELTEIENRLCRRLRQTEIAIAEMDRKLIVRAEKEAKLGKSLEARHKELQMGKRYSTRQGADDRGGRDEDFCELKNTVDQQFWNIKQQLEQGRIKMKRSHGSSSPIVLDNDTEPPDMERVHDVRDTETDHVSKTEIRIQEEDEEEDDDDDDDSTVVIKNVGSDQTGSEIDWLRETLDMAFGLMQNTMLVSEVRPMEMQWRGMLERETMSIFFKGAITELQRKLVAESQEKENHVRICFMLSKDWSELMTELTTLRSELEALISPINEVQRRSTRGGQDNCNTAPPLIRTRSPSPVADRNGRNLVPIIPIRTRSSSPVADRNFERASVRNPDFENEVKESEEGSDNLEEEQGGNSSSSVAKMIRTHETIIRQKSEELNWLKAQILREKGRLASTRECDLDELKKNIQNAIEKLDDFSKRNDKLGAMFSDLSMGSQNVGDSVPEDKRPKYFRLRLHDHDEENSTRSETICMDILREELDEHVGEIAKERKKAMDEFKVETGLMDEVFKFVCHETIKDMICTGSSKGNSDDTHDFSDGREEHHLETSIVKDIYGVLFKEMAHAFCEEVEACEYENLVLKTVYSSVVIETVKEYQSSFSPEQSIKHGDDIGENAGFIRMLDFILTSLEMEEDSVLRPRDVSKEAENANDTNLLLDKKADGAELLPDEDEAALSTINEKLEEALQRLDTSKMLLKELRYDQEAKKVNYDIDYNNSALDHDQKHAAIAEIHDEMQLVHCIPKEHEGFRAIDSFDPLLLMASLEVFPKHIVKFERVLHQKLDVNASRLEKLMDIIDSLPEHVTSLQEKECLYKQAFVRRCENLQKAEAEVDVLGDQVDALLRLLEKIYATLDYYSPVLQQYAGEKKPIPRSLT